MPYGGPYHGPDAVAENVFGPPIEDIPDFEATLQELIVSGDAVVVIARYTGTLTATGRALRPPRRDIWDVRDGKITRFQQFADTARLVEVVSAHPSIR
jgi:uncharacterized protein